MTNEKNPKLYSPLVLAYIGDGVYDLFVRREMVKRHPDMPAHKLHRETVKHVKAQAQSESMGHIEGLLTEEEEAVYKRGRNAKSATVPKNADVSAYRRATGFEALMGYLYLAGRTDRLEFLMEQTLEAFPGITG